VPPTSAMPLDSGWPDRLADMVLAFDASPERQGCASETECETPYWPHAPFAAVGTDFSYAEVMARVGRADEARTFLERAAGRDGFDEWPYRFLVDDALADIDGWVGRFDELPADEVVFGDMLINGETACVMCHQP